MEDLKLQYQYKKRETRELRRDIETCPECGHSDSHLDSRRGEYICEKCGLVRVDQIIDTGPEWRAFDASQRESRTRVGAPMTFTIHDQGLSTMIDWRNKDYAGKPISSKIRGNYYRMRKWQSRIRVSDAIERNLTFALSELDRMASVLGLHKNIRESCAKIYRKAVRNHLIRGRSIEGVAAAALYAACRLNKIPRTLNEIAEAARVDKKEIGRSYRFVATKLQLKSHPVSPLEYIPKFVSELELSNEVATYARKIIKFAQYKGLTSGRGPTGVASAAIYVACLAHNERRTQSEIAEIGQITEVTVRNRFKEMVKKLNLNLPK